MVIWKINHWQTYSVVTLVSNFIKSISCKLIGSITSSWLLESQPAAFGVTVSPSAVRSSFVSCQALCLRFPSMSLLRVTGPPFALVSVKRRHSRKSACAHFCTNRCRASQAKNVAESKSDSN